MNTVEEIEVEEEVVPVEYVAILIEVTQYVNEDLVEKWGKFYEVCLFNRKSYTYCCSMSPSYWLESIEYIIGPEKYPEDEVEKEELYNLLEEFQHDDHLNSHYGSYYDVSYIERLMKEDPTCFVIQADYKTKEPYQYEDMDEAVEDYRGNPDF